MTAGKIGAVLCNTASIIGLVVSVAERQPSLPSMKGINGVDVVLHLALICAVSYGVLWGIADHWLFNWRFGAGEAYTMPTGWAAVVLSLCITVPLALVPVAYQREFRIPVVILPAHWIAMGVVTVTAAIAHIIMYGHNGNGIRQRLSPTGEYPTASVGLMLEGLYTIVYFSLMVIPYRLIVQPHVPEET